MRCVFCFHHLEEIASDNLAIYRCLYPDCPFYRIYQAGEEEIETPDADTIAAQILAQYKDEPPSVPVAEH